MDVSYFVVKQRIVMRYSRLSPIASHNKFGMITNANRGKIVYSRGKK